MSRGLVAERMFFVTLALLFAASAALTILWCEAMSSMSAMRMPGGWALSMTWMRMPGQTWLDAAASFVGMWAIMMVAMMLPSLVPMLRSYRQVCGAQASNQSNQARLPWRTTLVGTGYFLVWTLLGAAIFPVGVALAALAMHLPALSRAVPLTGAVVIMIAGVLQFTPWKLRRLACCRELPARCEALQRGPLRHGLQLGVRCCLCCAGPTAVLLVLGVMDVRAMTAVAAAITAERLTRHGARVARALGIIGVAAGLLSMVRA
jgi:predicted metal-binding membrane protein